LTFQLDLDSVIVNQHTKGRLALKLLSADTETHTTDRSLYLDH